MARSLRVRVQAHLARQSGGSPSHGDCALKLHEVILEGYVNRVMAKRVVAVRNDNLSEVISRVTGVK